MQPQENPARVLLGLHGNSTEGFFLKNLYCLECISATMVFLKPFYYAIKSLLLGTKCVFKHRDLQMLMGRGGETKLQVRGNLKYLI